MSDDCSKDSSCPPDLCERHAEQPDNAWWEAVWNVCPDAPIDAREQPAPTHVGVDHAVEGGDYSARTVLRRNDDGALAVVSTETCQCREAGCRVCFGDQPEAVNHPDHYGGDDNPYEAIKVIEAAGWGEGFNRGNALKYLLRAGKKGSEVEDLRKARWYIARAIQRLGGE